MVASQFHLPIDHGIDPDLSTNDRKSLIKYRQDLRRASVTYLEAVKSAANGGPRELNEEVAAMVAYFEERTKEVRSW